MIREEAWDRLEEPRRATQRIPAERWIRLNFLPSLSVWISVQHATSGPCRSSEEGSGFTRCDLQDLRIRIDAKRGDHLRNRRVRSVLLSNLNWLPQSVRTVVDVCLDFLIRAGGTAPRVVLNRRMILPFFQIRKNCVFAVVNACECPCERQNHGHHTPCNAVSYGAF